MTTFSIAGMIIWVVMMVIGSGIRRVTTRKIRGLDGIKGFVNGRETKKYGEIVAKF